MLFPASHHPDQARTAAPTQSHTQRHLSKCQRRFSCRKKCMRGDGNEGVKGRPLFHTGNSRRIEWRCVACVTLARSQSRGTGSGRGSWGGLQALLCFAVSNHYQILHSNGRRAQAPPTESLEGYVRAPHFCILIIQLPLQGVTALWLCGFAALCLNGVLLSSFSE